MLSTRFRSVAPLAALLAVGLGGALAPSAAQAQTIENVAAGVSQNNGTYLWQYTVTSGQKPAISHFVLSLCLNAYNSIVPGSVMGSDVYSFVNPDPTTGATGIKFDEGYEGGEVRTVSFLLNQNFVATTGTATFKSGRIETSQQVIAPSCDVLPPPQEVIPEPGTFALLGAGVLPMMGAVVRRRRRS
jgi:hypothetical protein